MSIDWMGYHRAILENLKQGHNQVEELQEETCLTTGALVSIIGGLFAKKAVYSSRPGYLEITFHGERYLKELSTNTHETRRETE